MSRDMFGIVQKVLFFVLLAGITALFFWTLWGVVLPLFWAVVFAVLLYPAFVRSRTVFNGRASLAAIVTILLTLILILVPLSIVGSLVAEQATNIYREVSTNGSSYIPDISQIPFVPELIQATGFDLSTVETRLVDLFRQASGWIASQALSFGAQTASILIQLFVMLYVLFFLLRDGEHLVRYLQRLLPLGNDKEHALFKRFTSTTRAIVKGTVVVALVQGAIGGLLFWMVGIPGAVLWAIAMALTALIPAIGPGIIWVPAGVFLLITGDVVGGIIVLVGGGVVISLIDNILRPLLIGKDTEMPDALILLAILGGLTAFGLTGIIIGPVIAALLLSFWELFEREYRDDLATRG